MVFCQLTSCDWNRYSKRHVHYMCMKLVVHLNKDAECVLAKCMRDEQVVHDAHKT